MSTAPSENEKHPPSDGCFSSVEEVYFFFLFAGFRFFAGFFFATFFFAGFRFFAGFFFATFFFATFLFAGFFAFFLAGIVITSSLVVTRTFVAARERPRLVVPCVT
ncbi:hypothetical protein AMJ57_04535 [Parcubacteria bacterium SG8_24]|nr:MAG: hypothetical protein AMJ57_04535 [Parcubacteria bacterium SG8_24]